MKLFRWSWFSIVVIVVLLASLGFELHRTTRHQSVMRWARASGGRVYFENTISSSLLLPENVSRKPQDSRLRRFMRGEFGETVFGRPKFVVFGPAANAGHVRSLKNAPTVSGVLFVEATLSALILDQLGAMPHVVDVTFYKCRPLNEEIWSSLAACPQLEVLNVARPTLPNVPLQCLAQLDRLRVLSVDWASVRATDLSHLARPELLEELSLNWSQPIGGMSFIGRSGFNHLRQLSLNGAKLAKGDLELIAEQCTQLSVLRLANSNVDDSQLDVLARMSNLSYLFVAGS